MLYAVDAILRRELSSVFFENRKRSETSDDTENDTYNKLNDSSCDNGRSGVSRVADNNIYQSNKKTRQEKAQFLHCPLDTGSGRYG